MFDEFRNRKQVLIIAGIMALGIFLRFYHLGTFGIWYDEEVTLSAANGVVWSSGFEAETFTNEDYNAQNTLSNVVDATVADNGNGILYNILLHFWTTVFGRSDFAARSLSAVFGILLIPLGYVMVRVWDDNNRNALFTAFLLAIQPILVMYSHETRAYSMAIFFSVLSTLLLFRTLNAEQPVHKKVQWFLLYGLSIAVAFCSHYLTIYVFAPHAAAIGWVTFTQFFSEKSEKPVHRQWPGYVLAGVIALVFIGIWMLNGGLEGLEVMGGQNSKWAGRAAENAEATARYVIPLTIKNGITGLFQITLHTFGNGLQDTGLRIREIAVLLVFPFGLLGLTFLNSLKMEDTMKFFWNASFVGVMIAFVTVLALRSGHCISFQPKYGLFAVPYATILLGNAMGNLRELKGKTRIAGIVLGAGVILIMLASLHPVLTDFVFYRDARTANPYETLADEIEAVYEPGDTIIHTHWKDAQLLNLYLDPDRSFLQKFDSTGTRAHISLSKNGHRQLIVDFNERRYNYYAKE